MIATLLLALAPIAFLIGLGAWLRRSHFLAESFWPQAERLGYYVLLPSLFLHGLATARLDGVPIWAMVATLVCSTVVVAAILLEMRHRLAVDDPALFTSVFQGGVRFNNYVGVSAAAGILGAQGIALAAVANAAIVPTVNVLCVLVFARYGSQGRLSPKKVAWQLAINPLVVACVVGIALQVSGIGLPPMIEPVLKALGQASLPLGLLVGAALEFSAAKNWLNPIGASSVAKFGLMPLATLGACYAFGLSGPAAIAALLFQTLPTASSSYIMARQLGGDAPLMAGIVAAQTLLATIFLPLSVLVLAGFINSA